MNNYRLTIQYDGGRYKGWQRLGNEENTIQGKIEYVISEMVGTETELTGCSRTDAGVHALEQVANFKTEKNLSEEEVKAYLNHYLPKDISVIKVSRASENFHARYLAKNKTYLYKIWNEPFSNPFMRKYSMHVEQKLDIDFMRRARVYFIGEHDFTAFSNAKSKKKSMVREIYSIEFKEDNGFIEVRICGDGFLYNQVRRMVGTLIEIGLGRMKPEVVTEIMEDKERSKAGFIAEAQGLYLEKVTY